ncbi:MAG: hypothetical protein K0R50_422 [Eubacterium sp.]|jgi:uncharacterized CHY-type Zn-finger protein|nr:hypothetical protein [Eubacterium sp.]
MIKTDVIDETSANKQKRLNCHIGRGVNNWNCYNDCAFWDGGICTNYEEYTKLKPCPFCGNEHPLITENSYVVEISCPCCQTKFQNDCTAWHDHSKGETIKRWNRRAEEVLK